MAGSSFVARTSAGLTHFNWIRMPWSTTAITAVKVVSLRFKSDHHLMKDYAADWKDGGAVFPKPEWTYGNPSAPISHDKDKAVAAEIELEVYPTNAAAVLLTIQGKTPGGTITFDGSGTLGGGKHVIPVASAGPLPNAVKKLHGEIEWTVTPAGGAALSADKSWGHEIYLTMSTPVDPTSREAGITRKHLEAAVQQVGKTGESDPHKIVDKLMRQFPGYTLQPDPAVPAEFKHPTYFNHVGGAWPMFDFLDKSAECQAIVRYVRAVINEVGCPGTPEFILVWADPDVNNGNDVLEGRGGLNDKHKTVGKEEWYAFLSDVHPEKGKLYDPTGKEAPYIGANNFEACLRFTHGGTTKYYGGGAGVYDTKEQVIKAFHALVWASVETSPRGNALYRIREVVKRWRDKNGNVLP